jgi:hypothetical protein
MPKLVAVIATFWRPVDTGAFASHMIAAALAAFGIRRARALADGFRLYPDVDELGAIDKRFRHWDR